MEQRHNSIWPLGSRAQTIMPTIPREVFVAVAGLTDSMQPTT